MDRLTARSHKNNMAYLVNVKDSEQDVTGYRDTLICTRNAFQRLAQYEDSGLSPEEVKGLQQEIEKLKTILKTINGTTHSIHGILNCGSCRKLTNQFVDLDGGNSK